jgi:hypothetical protein
VRKVEIAVRHAVIGPCGRLSTHVGSPLISGAEPTTVHRDYDVAHHEPSEVLL